ncbi:MAG: hypothetical protein IJC04_01605 [Oscillospiraceae bacterium]|nr:hypothetical protein [Oscillospiraceae bacterium]
MKLTKNLIAIAMAVTMTISTAATSVSAAKWVKADNGVKYQYDNGSYAKSKWIKTKTGKYYIKSNGTRATGWMTIKSNGTSYKYYFDEKGVMQTGWQTIDGKVYYFNKTSGKMTANKKIVIGSYSYKFDKNGVWTGKVYSKDGKKNVTKSVNVEKLTGQKVTTTTSSNKTTTTKETKNELGVVKTVSGEIPETVTIKGKKYVTSATNKYIGMKADVIYPEGFNGNKYQRGNMWDFDISGCTDKDLEVLKYFKNITSLNLVDWENTSTITNLDFCYYMPNLEYVYVSGAVNLTNVDGLSVCKKLKRVEIKFCKLENVDGLSTLKNIQVADFAYTWLDNVNGLANCKNLKEVTVTHARLTDISALKDKDKLEVLELNCNRRLKDINALATCDSLKTLYMNSCTGVNTWEVLKEIPNLKNVALCWNVIGKEGPYEVAEWLNAHGVGASYISDNTYREGTHVFTKEIASDKAWDEAYRPEVVYGDDRECKPDCVWCEDTETLTERTGID